MWLVSCRRQWILTQRPTPDPGCKLNISSFLRLPHLLDCLICTRNSMSKSYYYKWWGNEIGGGGWFISECRLKDKRWILSESCFYLCFCFCFVFVFLLCPLPLFFKWLEHDSCCVCFFVYYLCSLSLVSLTISYWCIEIVLSHIKLFIKLVSDHYSVDFLGKDGVF